jgi:glutathione S-transferase
MAIKLYYAPGACSFASHIALEEAGLTYDTQKMNLADGDQKKPEYLRLNPRGRVPTLVVDGQVLTENVGILTYVGGGYPQAGLWPKKTWDQAKLVSTLAWLSNTVHPAYAHIVRPERYATDDASKENIKARAKDVFQGHLEEIDQLLEGQKWTVANQFTVADGYLLVFYRWANRQKMPVRELKNYSALVQRVMARPAVQRVMAQEGITLES